MTEELLPVLIVGAGPSGLVSALWLAQSGIRVRIIDRVDSHRIGSRGFGLQPRTLEFFQYLGIHKQVLQRATAIPTLRAYKLPGGTEVVKTWDLYEKRQVWPDRPYANGLCLDQTDLEQIMRDRLTEFNVTVELNKALTSIEQRDGDNAVIATITTCKNGELTEETEKISAQYVIGGDGAKGVSRKLLGLTFQGETRDADGMVWGDVEIHNLSPEFWHVWSVPGRYSVMMRPTSPNGKVFHIAIVGQNFDPVEQAIPEKAVEFIKKETGREDLQFGKWTWISHYKPNIRVVNKFREGRVFLVGDAAHVHSPSGGQGLNCSIQDASNISWKLALVLKSYASPSLLDTYNEERLPVITQMLYATSKLYTHLVAKEKSKADAPDSEADKAALASKPVPATANDKSQFLQWRNEALELYGVNYRFSSIVLEDRADTKGWDAEDVRAHAYSGYEGHDSLCAGDRAPDAPGLYDIQKNESTSFLENFKSNKHTILIFTKTMTALRSSVLEVIQGYPADIVQSFVICDGLAAGNGSHNEYSEKLNQITSPAFGVLEDRESHAAKNYRIFNSAEGDITIFIVRPDSFIGAITRNVDGVKNYFGKILF